MPLLFNTCREIRKSGESQMGSSLWTCSFSMPKIIWLNHAREEPCAVMRSFDAAFNHLERKSKQRDKPVHLFSLQLLVFTTLCKQSP